MSEVVLHLTNEEAQFVLDTLTPNLEDAMNYASLRVNGNECDGFRSAQDEKRWRALEGVGEQLHNSVFSKLNALGLTQTRPCFDGD